MIRKLKGLFVQICDETNLRVAFDRVSDNQGAPGVDGVTVEQFARRLDEHIETIIADLHEQRYRAKPARPVEIPKSSGGKRRLLIPAVRDRVIQTAASSLLVSGLEPVFHPLSFGYRPGRSVQQACRQVDHFRRAGLTWAVDADIHSYFDSVRHDRLIARLQEHVADDRFVDLISLWLETYGVRGRGLPQGSPISPVLANLFLDCLDDAFDQGPHKLIRYADDFVILAKQREAAETARALAEKVLSSQALDLHPHKTRIVNFDQGFRFLGRLFIRSLVIEDPWDEPIDITALPKAVELPAQDTSKEEDHKRPAPRKRSLYLASDATLLSVGTGYCLEITESGHLRLRVRPDMLDRVEIYPGAAIAQVALRLLMRERIPVVFLEANGEPIGTVHGRAGHQGKLHLAQAAVVLDPARRLDFARSFVEARIHNHRALLRRLNRNRGDLAVVRACEEINRILRKVQTAEDFSSLMPYEAHSAKLYWSVLGQLLPDGWVFEKRQRRPPGSPFDVILSYLSAILTSDMEAVVVRAGLHPSFGILHSTKNDESVCATDLVEEFRGPIAEACAVTLVAQRAVALDGFTIDPISGVGYIMSDDARDAIIRGYERWLDRPISDPSSPDKCPWSELMRRQAQRLAAALTNGTPYSPYRMDY